MVDTCNRLSVLTKLGHYRLGCYRHNGTKCGLDSKIEMMRPTMKIASGPTRLLIDMLLIIAFSQGLAQGAMTVLQLLNAYWGADLVHLGLMLSPAGSQAYFPTGAAW